MPWIQVSNTIEKIEYSYEPHNAKPLKGVPWLCCKKCGLLYLHNPITDWCIRMGCNSDDHPSYKNTLKRLTKQE